MITIIKISLMLFLQFLKELLVSQGMHSYYVHIECMCGLCVCIIIESTPSHLHKF